MATNTCNQNCGCNNTYTVTAPCPPSCPEVFNAQCIVYTGTDILCGQDTVIKRYDYLDTVITKLVNYICNGLANVPTTVVESDSEYILVTSSILGNQTTYVLDLDFTQLAADLNLTLPVYNVVGSQNITVTTTTVDNTTTFNLLALETILQNTDNLLNITANTTPGIDIVYTVNVDLPALTAAIPTTAVAPGPSANSFVTASTTGNLTTYSIDSKESIVVAGDNVTVTAAGGTAPAYDTTYTVDSEAAALTLVSGETLLNLTSTYDAPNHMTNYELGIDVPALTTFVNTEINDVLDNVVSGFGIDAVYDNLTQTLSVEFIGAAVDGTTITGDGTAANPLQLVGTYPQKYPFTGNLTAPGGTLTINHTLNTLDLVVSLSEDGIPPLASLSPGASQDYTYTIQSTSQVIITAGAGWGGGLVRGTLIG